MAWATPVTRATGDLITAAIWNTDVNDLIYLKDYAGGLLGGQGSQLTAASTITVTNKVHEITGATTVNTINGGTAGDLLFLVVANGQTLTLGGSANVWPTNTGASRAVPQNQGVALIYKTSAWYVTGVGS